MLNCTVTNKNNTGQKNGPLVLPDMTKTVFGKCVSDVDLEFLVYLSVPSANTEGEGFMTYTAASRQLADFMAFSSSFWLQLI